jgi:hypothetical protein
MFNQALLWTLLIAPWFLLLFLEKNRRKKFLPAGLFASLVLTFIFQIGDKFQWWKITENIILLSNTTTLVYGLYLVGTIIILYLTYHSFRLYMLTNLVIDSILAFGIGKWFQHLGLYQLININSFGVLILALIIALLIYIFQKWLDPVFIQNDTRELDK